MKIWFDARAPRALSILLAWLLAGFNPTWAFECPELRLDPRPLEASRFDSGLLFRVQSDAGPSYVFGTIHVSDPENPRIAAPVEAALKESRAFVMEVLLDTSTMMSMANEMFYSDGRRLSDDVGAELAQRTAELLAHHGISGELAQAMKPWAAFMTLSLPAGPQTVPLDLLLMQQAASAGLALNGLETLEEQTRIFTDLAEEDQVTLLLQTVCYYDRAQSELAELIGLYERRDLGGLLKLATRYASDPPEFQEEFLAALLWDRNDRMVERMLPLLNEGGAFVAVGALHLPGKRGLLEQLAQRGFRVERVY
jgi:hypothetical protein